MKFTEIALYPDIKKRDLSTANLIDSAYRTRKDANEISSEKTFTFDSKLTVAISKLTANTLEVFLVGKEDQRVAAYMLLYRFGTHGFTVEEVKVRSSHQGQGLGLKLYKYLIKEVGITLISGHVQSPGAAKLWTALYKSPGINVYGYDPQSKDSKFFHVEPDASGMLDTLAGTDLYKPGRARMWSRKVSRLVATAD
jgi:predicted GNAT family acetyltransferase